MLVGLRGAREPRERRAKRGDHGIHADRIECPGSSHVGLSPARLHCRRDRRLELLCETSGRMAGRAKPDNRFSGVESAALSLIEGKHEERVKGEKEWQLKIERSIC